jgi:hypothetical protein
VLRSSVTAAVSIGAITHALLLYTCCHSLVPCVAAAAVAPAAAITNALWLLLLLLLLPPSPGPMQCCYYCCYLLRIASTAAADAAAAAAAITWSHALLNAKKRIQERKCLMSNHLPLMNQLSQGLTPATAQQHTTTAMRHISTLYKGDLADVCKHVKAGPHAYHMLRQIAAMKKAIAAESLFETLSLRA